MENISLYFELVANFFTIFGVAIAMLSYSKRIYDNFRPLKKAFIVHTNSPYKDLITKPNYLWYGDDIFFTLYLKLNRYENVIIDKIGLSVQHGLMNDQLLFHQDARQSFHFSVSKEDCDAIYDKDFYGKKNKFGIRDFYLFDKIYIEKKSIFSSRKLFRKRKEMLEKYNNSNLDNIMADTNELFIAFPVIYIDITSNGVKSTYFIYTALTKQIIF